MEKTFLQIQEGDIIYYINFEKSKLVTNKILSSVVSKVRNTGLVYEKEITLNNGLKFICNWNSSVHKNPIINDEELKTRYSIAEPFFFTLYSTDKKLLKETACRLVEEKIMKLGTIQMEMQEELVRLSGLKIMAKGLDTSKVEELVAEIVIV